MLNIIVINCAASEGRSETGHVVRDNVTAWLELNGDDGRLRIVRQMDREKAETIRLVVRVEDTAATTSHQTASGTVIPIQCLSNSYSQL